MRLSNLHFSQQQICDYLRLRIPVRHYGLRRWQDLSAAGRVVLCRSMGVMGNQCSRGHGQIFGRIRRSQVNGQIWRRDQLNGHNE